MKNKLLFIFISCCLFCVRVVAQCTTGCTLPIVTTTTTGPYTVSAGQTLCIAPTGKITGTITLSGGTICNNGTLQASSFTVTSGTINNYGYIFQVGNLQLSGSSVLNNYNFVEVQSQFLVAPTAKYLTQNAQAVLWVYPFTTTLTANPNASYAKLVSTMDGGTYLASDGFLYFQYDEEYTAGTLQYKVYGNDRSLVMSNASNALVKAYGDNRYALKVGCVLPIGDYVMEVTTDKSEISYLRFRVNNLQYCP
jgi:hypothetical protein